MPGDDGDGGGNGGGDGNGDPVCALCLRPIPPGTPADRHHLVPRLKGGAKGPTVPMHRMCHNEVHAVLSEGEIARRYATPEALRAHPHLARFAEWLQGKDPAFHVRTLKNRRLRR